MDDLKAVAAELRDLDHVRHEQVEQRDTLVVNAYRAGTPIAHIAKAAGLTRARVYAIINRTTKETNN